MHDYMLSIILQEFDAIAIEITTLIRELTEDECKTMSLGLPTNQYLSW